MHMHDTSHTTTETTPTAKDPVCGMSVTVTDDAITRDHNGKTYYFCSEHCAQTFEKSPMDYADKD